MPNGVGDLAAPTGDLFERMKPASAVFLGLNQVSAGVRQDRNLTAPCRLRQVNGRFATWGIGVEAGGGDGVAAGGGAVELEITVGGTAAVVLNRRKAMANGIVAVQINFKGLFPVDQRRF